MRRWWRQFWRKRTLPVPRSEAEAMKRKLSLAYAFCAWNACGLMIYNLIHTSYPMTKEEKAQPARYYARILQADDVSVINISGLSVKGRYEIKGLPPLIPEEFAEDNNSEKEHVE